MKLAVTPVIRRNAALAVALLSVNAWAVYGQAGWAHSHLALAVPAAVAFALTVEAISVYLAYEAHVAQLAGDSSIRVRAASYGAGVVAGYLNFSHYAPDAHHAPAQAWIFGGLSALSPWLWAIRSRSLHRDVLRAAGQIDPRAARFAAARWLHYPLRTLRALRWSIAEGVNDPAAAWAGGGQRRAVRRSLNVALTVPPGPVSGHRPPPAGRPPAAGLDGQADDTPALPPPAASLTVTNPPSDRQAGPSDRHRQTVSTRRTAGHRTAKPTVAVAVMTAARDHHAEHGEWPSPAALMAASGASESTVTRALKQLRTAANGHHAPAGVP